MSALAVLAAAQDAGWAQNTCHGTGQKYDCTSPVTTGCSATTITECSATIRSSAGSVLGTVQLRYSTHCNTSWTRTVSNVGSTSLTSTLHRVWWDVVPATPVGDAQAIDTATSNYTPQLFDGALYNSYGVGHLKGSQQRTCSF